VVPKHRRSEFEPSLTPAGGPANAAEYWSEPVGYDTAAPPGWAAAPEGPSWQDWQDWGQAPALPPDHPSAPMPRVQFPADHPSAPLPAYRDPRAPDFPLPAQQPAQPAADLAGPEWRETTGYAHPPTRPRRDTTGYQWPAGPGWQEAADYRETGPAGPGPAPGRSQNDRSPNRDSLLTAGQVVPRPGGQTARDAQDYAAAIRDAAERDAAAIREAAEREALELRDRLQSMSGELGRMAAYVAESLAGSAMPATAPALPAGRPALPAGRPALPATRVAMPDTRPGARPEARPVTRPEARPATRPETRPAGPPRPRTTPAKGPQKRPRQQRAIRIATGASAALLLFAVGCGAAEIGSHGFAFFVFRESGVGSTAGNSTDQGFLNRQAAAHHAVAPNGRHAR
jgi:hypothetical protein